MPRNYKNTLTNALYLSLPRPPQFAAVSKHGAETEAMGAENQTETELEHNVSFPELAKLPEISSDFVPQRRSKKKESGNRASTSDLLPFLTNFEIHPQLLDARQVAGRKDSFLDGRHRQTPGTSSTSGTMREKRVSRKQYLISRLMCIEAEAGNAMKVKPKFPALPLFPSNHCIP